MRNALKLLIVGAVAGLAMAEPALAQSFSPDFGTANTLPLAYAPHAVTPDQSARSAGRNAFAQEPERGVTVQRGVSGTAAGYDALVATY